jgi:hypothetical protein
MKAARGKVSAFGVALIGASVAACAGIVGADFNDVHGTTGSAITEDGGHVIQPDDSGSAPDGDSSTPIILADGGACPAGSGLTACPVGNVDLCVDIATDPDHCNSCQTVCPSDPHGNAVCVNRHCTFACGAGYSLCDAGGSCCPIASGTDASVDSAPPPDPGIPCATTYCAVDFDAGAFCCGDNQGTPAGDICTTNAGAVNLECNYAFYCGSAGDCPQGNVCCYDSSNSNSDPNAESSFCATSCPSGGNYIQFCNPAASNECTGGTLCTGSFDGNQDELQTTYHYCQ